MYMKVTIALFLCGSFLLQISYAQNIKWKRNESTTTHLETFSFDVCD